MDREIRQAIEFVLHVKSVYTLNDIQRMDVVEFQVVLNEALKQVAEAKKQKH
jgi:hypothetical protein